MSAALPTGIRRSNVHVDADILQRLAEDPRLGPKVAKAVDAARKPPISRFRFACIRRGASSRCSRGADARR